MKFRSINSVMIIPILYSNVQYNFNGNINYLIASSVNFVQLFLFSLID